MMRRRIQGTIKRKAVESNTVASWGQVCSGIAMLGLLLGSGAAFAYVRLGEQRTHTFNNTLAWSWRGGVLLSAGALLASVILQSVSPQARPSTDATLLSSVAGKATLVALVASLLQVSSEWRNVLVQKHEPGSWAGLIPVVIVVGVSAFRWPVGASPAPVLLICTLIAAGFGTWAAGRELEMLMTGKDNHNAAAITFAALSANVAVIAGINWRVWGMPIGTAVGGPEAWNGALKLFAAWLINAAGLVLQQRSAKLAGALCIVAATLLVAIGLSARWALPFS